MLQGADVATLAADDTALHVLRRQWHDRGCGLRNHVASEPLHGGGYDLAGALVRLLLDLLLNLAQEAVGIVPYIALHLGEKDLLGLADCQAGDALKLLLVLLFELPELVLSVFQLAFLVLEVALALLQGVQLAV